MYNQKQLLRKRIVVLFTVLFFYNYSPLSAEQISQCSENKNLKISYLVNGHTVISEFWRLNVELTKTVATQMGIDLDVRLINPDFQHRLVFHEFLQDYLDRLPIKPDYIIGPIYYNSLNRTLEIMEELGIQYISVNSSMLPRQIKKYGGPGRLSERWLAHISPNERESGYQMALDILGRQTTLPSVQPVAIIIGGKPSDTVSILRTNGFKQGLLELGQPPAQIFYTDWLAEDAENVLEVALRRFGGVDYIFTVSASLASGTSAVLRRHNISPLPKIGTFDWNSRSALMVEQGLVNESYGGHFIESGQALVMAYDHYHGLPLSNDKDKTIFTTILKPLTKQNSRQITNWLASEKWKQFNYRTFSRCLTPGANIEDFTIHRIYEQTM